MIKTTSKLFGFTFSILLLASSTQFHILNENEAAIQELTHQFSQIMASPSSTIVIAKQDLPNPYDQLLTQPLMTKALESYYTGRPRIEILTSQYHQHTHIYERSIIMQIDNHTIPSVVELAHIAINFSQISPQMREEIRNTTIPFGQLLVNHHVKITNRDRQYFSMPCSNPSMAILMHCQSSERLYGRTNTLVRVDNSQWIAKVIEILPLL